MRVAVLVIVALCARSAYAEDGAPAPASTDPAREEFLRALAVYNAGDFAASIDGFHKAYDLDPTKSQYLFSWAQALRRSGDCTKALELYAKVLAMPLDKRNAAATRQAMAMCERPTIT